jgi:hypothetical protein
MVICLMETGNIITVMCSNGCFLRSFDSNEVQRRVNAIKHYSAQKITKTVKLFYERNFGHSRRLLKSMWGSVYMVQSSRACLSS